MHSTHTRTYLSSATQQLNRCIRTCFDSSHSHCHHLASTVPVFERRCWRISRHIYIFVNSHDSHGLEHRHHVRSRCFFPVESPKRSQREYYPQNYLSSNSRISRAPHSQHATHAYPLHDRTVPENVVFCIIQSQSLLLHMSALSSLPFLIQQIFSAYFCLQISFLFGDADASSHILHSSLNVSRETQKLRETEKLETQQT